MDCAAGMHTPGLTGVCVCVCVCVCVECGHAGWAAVSMSARPPVNEMEPEVGRKGWLG